MQGLLARLVCRYAREAARSAGFAKAREGRHPHRIAGDEPMPPGILWGCRACGAPRATAPRRLSGHVAGGVRKGEEAGSAPLGRLGEPELAEAAPAPAALGAREAVR